MIVTNDDIASGRLGILPVGWRERGTVAQAFRAERVAWRDLERGRKLLGEPPSGWGLIYAADSDRALVFEVEVERREISGNLIIKMDPDLSSNEPLLRSISMDFDVVDLVTGKVVAEARRNP